MKKYITGIPIANGIRMRRSTYDGAFLIVEGDSDKKLYSNFVDENNCRIEPAEGKPNVQEAMAELNRKGGMSGVLAVIDADFELLDNSKSSNLQNVYYTDTHDSETMIIKSKALERVLIEYGSEEKIEKFKARMGKDVRKALIGSAVTVGYLRWASLIKDIRINFGEIKYDENIIDYDQWTIDTMRMILKVKADQKSLRINENEILKTVNVLQKKAYDPWMICCGHDLVLLLSLLLQREIGIDGKSSFSVSEIARALRLAYGFQHFIPTHTCHCIKEWERDNKPYKVMPEVIIL